MDGSNAERMTGSSTKSNGTDIGSVKISAFEHQNSCEVCNSKDSLTLLHIGPEEAMIYCSSCRVKYINTQFEQRTQQINAFMASMSDNQIDSSYTQRCNQRLQFYTEKINEYNKNPAAFDMLDYLVEMDMEMRDLKGEIQKASYQAFLKSMT